MPRLEAEPGAALSMPQRGGAVNLRTRLEPRARSAAALNRFAAG
jgi:hypothetical protein